MDGSGVVTETKLGSNHDVDERCEVLKAAWKQGSINELRQAALGIREVLAIEGNPPIQRVLDSGSVPILLDILAKYGLQYPQLCHEALWALTNISSGSSKQTAIIFSLGTVDVLRQIVHECRDDNCLSQAVWCLVNIAIESAEFRDAILRMNLTPIIRRRVEDVESPIALRRNLAWLASTLCGVKPRLKNLTITRPLIETAAKCVLRGEAEDIEVLTESLWTLAHCSDEAGNSRIYVQGTGVLPAVCAVGKFQSIGNKVPENMRLDVLAPALQVVSNFISGEDDQADLILECDGLSVFAKVLHARREDLVPGACLMLNLLTLGTESHALGLLRHRTILPYLIDILETGGDVDTRLDIVSLFCNIVQDLDFEVLEPWLPKYPFCQILLHAFRQSEPFRAVGRAGLKALLTGHTQACVNEVRNRDQVRLGLRSGLLETSWANEIPHDSELDACEIADIVWLLIAMGLPDRRRITRGGAIVEVFEQYARDSHFRQRLSALRTMTMILAVTKPLLDAQVRPWLPVDLWHHCWGYLNA